MEFDMIIPCLFGVESFLSRELKWLGIENTKAEDGRVSFRGTVRDMINANLWIRTGERVLIKLAEFEATDFDRFYQGIFLAPWGDFLPEDARLSISGHCLKSKLSSSPRCRAITKKAIADSLGKKYGISHLEETGREYEIRFSLFKDKVTVSIDTTGEGLHKRGYRAESNAAPLRETLAATLVYLSRWRYEDALLDPFAGSGTIAIEAAMIKRNIAPGLKRNFLFENYDFVDSSLLDKLKAEALSKEKDVPLDITAVDIDEECVKLIKENAKKAGVSEYINVVLGDAREYSPLRKGGTIITNPPYGERLLSEEDCKKLYKDFGKKVSSLHSWSAFILASSDEFEKDFGKKAQKTRKLYNGMLPCRVYQYFEKRN